MLHPLATMNVLHNKKRSLISIIGISFVIMIIFFQMGAYDKVLDASMQVYDALNFDVIIISHNYFHMGQADVFPRSRTFQAQQITGVKAVYPLYLSLAPWRNSITAESKAILVMGVNAKKSVEVFNLPSMRDNIPHLTEAYSVFIRCAFHVNFMDPEK